jgi:molecular chaperone Hsp33
MTSQGYLRGYAALREAEIVAASARESERRGVETLLGRGYLAFTVDQGVHSDRYQGIVELRGASLAECLQHYFLQSEQIQTGVLAAAGRDARGRWRSAGIVLQRIPPEGGDFAAQSRRPVVEVDEDAWRRAMVLLASCTEAELLDAGLPVNDLLFRLFHEEGVRVFARRPLRDRCRCRRKRLEGTLRSLPRAEIDDLMLDGEIVVTCEFCRKSYRFDRAALDRIYAS